MSQDKTSQPICSDKVVKRSIIESIGQIAICISDLKRSVDFIIIY